MPSRRRLITIIAAFIGAGISFLFILSPSNNVPLLAGITTASQLDTPGNEFYVSPAGSPAGNGTMRAPWDLRTALSHPRAVRPGDTIWLRGGTYRGVFRSLLTGAPGRPIKVRSYPGEWARVDGEANRTFHVINVNGRFTWYMEFEVFRSGFNREIFRSGCGITLGGIDVNTPNNKLINLVVHDTSLGIGVFSDAPNTEVYGNILYYNGWIELPRGRACDHGIYGQNRFGNKVIKDNISFQNFATGITPHGTTVAFLNNFEIEGNVAFNNGIIALSRGKEMEGRNLWWSNCCPTANVAQNPRIVNNYTYYPDTVRGAGSFFILAATANAVISGNYMMGGTLRLHERHPNIKFTDNSIYADDMVGVSKSAQPDNKFYSAKPESNAVFVRPNQYDNNRAHIIVYNWEKLDSAEINISNLGFRPGDPFELRNVQDYFSDVVRGTYDGQPIRVPMTGRTMAEPVDWKTPAPSFPEFGVFVLIRNNSRTFSDRIKP